MNRNLFLTIFLFFIICEKSFGMAVYKDEKINTSKVWEGEVSIYGKIVITQNATLTIKPGTKIFFNKVDQDNDGESETTIIVNGNIIAEGTKELPILFSSNEVNKDWGDWKEIQINHAKNFKFLYSIFEFSEYGLHIHFSHGIIKNCIFRKNGDATRLGNSKIEFTNNLFEHNNGKALNFTNCNLIFKNNTVRNNREGIFVFEKVGNAEIQGNNIYQNFVNITTGDFFTGVLSLGLNYLDNTVGIKSGIKFVSKESPFIGILPELKDAYVKKTVHTEGFVDGDASANSDSIFFSSFDGHLYRYFFNSGIVKRITIGDFFDCKPLILGKYLVVTTWSGIATAYDIEKEDFVWKIQLNQSLKDDHRMSSPVIVNKNLIIARTDGNVYEIDIGNGKIINSYTFEDEFRATPLVLDNKIYLLGVMGSIISIDIVDKVVKVQRLEASFYSQPVLYRDKIVAVDKNGKLFFISYDLIVKKQYKLDATFRHQTPIVYNDKLFLFSLDGKVITVNDDRIETEELNEIFTSKPAIIYDYIVVPTFSGKLLFYSKEKHFFLNGFGEIQFSPYFSNDELYLGTRDNKIYVIKPW